MNSLDFMEQSKYAKWIDRILWILAAVLPVVIIPIDVVDIFDTIKGPILVVAGISILVLLILEKKWDNSLISWFLLVYVFFQFLSSVFAYNPLLAFAGETPKAGRFEGFASLVIYAILFYAAKNFMIPTQKKVITTFSVLSIVSVYALVQYFQYDPLVIYKHYRSMIFSTIGNQNFLGSLVIMLTVLALGLFIYFKKWYYGLFFSLFFSTLLVAQTRSCWLSFAFILVLITFSVVIFHRDKWDSFLVAILLMVAISVELNKTKKNILSTRSGTIKKELAMKDEYGGSGRLKIWEITGLVIQDHPLLGTGPENLKTVIHAEHKKEINAYYRVKGTSVDKAHNEFLHIAAVTGIPSLLIYLSMILIIFIQNGRFLFRENMKTLLLLTILAYLVQAFFNISVIAVAPIFWILLGLLAQKTEKNHQLISH
jgi:putative inorganic carbon (HCO3(-)) transporter